MAPALHRGLCEDVDEVSQDDALGLTIMALPCKTTPQLVAVEMALVEARDALRSRLKDIAAGSLGGPAAAAVRYAAATAAMEAAAVAASVAAAGAGVDGAVPPAVAAAAAALAAGAGGSAAASAAAEVDSLKAQLKQLLSQRSQQMESARQQNREAEERNGKRGWGAGDGCRLYLSACGFRVYAALPHCAGRAYVILAPLRLQLRASPRWSWSCCSCSSSRWPPPSRPRTHRPRWRRPTLPLTA